MGQILIYVGIGVILLGVVILFTDAITYRKRREKKLAEIERNFK